MIEDDTNTSFSTEESVDEVTKPTQTKSKKRKRPQKTGLKKVSKEYFKTQTNTQPKTIIKQVKGEKSKPKQVQKSLKVAPKKVKSINEKKTPIGVFTKTILEALYDLNKSQKWT